MNISLTKLPWYGQIGAFVVLAVAGCGGFYYYYEMPVQKELLSRRNQLTGLRADITLLDAPDWRYLAYHLAGDLVSAVVRAGSTVYRR